MEPPARPPVSGDIKFTSETEGWLVGGVSGDELYKSEDQGESWKRIQIQAPSSVGGEGISYGLPEVSADGSGLLPGTFNGGVGETAVGVYSTSNSGLDWALDSLVPLKGSIGPGVNPPDTAFLGDESLVVEDPGSAGLTQVTPSAVSQNTNHLAAQALPGFASMTFSDQRNGVAVINQEVCKEKVDCVAESRLLFTGDGGESWEPRTQP